MTQQQATELEQAIKTAQKNGHRVYTATVNATGATCYTVRSHSDPNTFHILHIDGGRIRCDCSRHHHGHICSHAAAVRLFLIAQRDALAQVEARDAQEREAERAPDLGPCVTCGKPAEELNGVVCSNHLDDPMCHECHMADWTQVRENVARERAIRDAKREADRLASLPRVLAGVSVCEAEKLERLAIVEQLAEPMKQNAAAWEVERYKAQTLADEAFMQMAVEAQRQRAAKREAALLADHTPERFSIYASER